MTIVLIDNNDDVVDQIKSRLLDVHANGMNNAWNEGYISAMTDAGMLTEDEFDDMIKWIKSTPE